MKILYFPKKIHQFFSIILFSFLCSCLDAYTARLCDTVTCSCLEVNAVRL